MIQQEPEYDVVVTDSPRRIPTGQSNDTFSVCSFLTHAGEGRRLVHLRPKQILFSQGHPADCVFYLQTGRARLTVVSASGKEATVSIVSAEDFIGEEAVANAVESRPATATALTACSATCIDRQTVLNTLQKEPDFSELFLEFLVKRSMRTQADLVDQLFNSSEKRLARILLLMAEVNTTKEPDTLIPPITQETLAEMVGTTRSRVSFFMNRFRKQGFIQYNGRIRVHQSLLNVVLQDQPPGKFGPQNAPLLGDSKLARTKAHMRTPAK